MPTDIYLYIRWTWIATGIVWLAASLATKRTARSQSESSRVIHVAIMAAAFVLLFSSKLATAALSRRFVPESSVIAWAGFAITVAGCGFAIWARMLLGSNWSGNVTVKQDHQLVRRGPYTIVRHPIYSGGLLGILGTALAIGEVRGLLALALAFVGWLTKSRLEEAFMTQQFGAAYTDYRREVKALIPFVL